MKVLVLMRHGPAGNSEKLDYPDDGLRPLTDRGRKVVRKVAKGMLKDGLRPDVILTSPLVRARETADIVGSILEPAGGVESMDELVFGNPLPVVVEAVAGYFTKADCVLAVGHETDLSRLASTLVSGRPNSAMELRKGGWILLVFQDLRSGKCATLGALVNPRPFKLGNPSMDKKEVE